MDAGTHFWWFVARSAGITSFGLLTLSVWLGLGVTTRIFDGLLDRPWVYEVHKFSTLLALAFAGVHVLSLLLDPFIAYTPADVLIPGLSAYRPLATAAGIFGLYATVVITASFYVRNHIGYRAWRLLHYASPVGFALLLLHGLFAGSDSSVYLMRYFYWAAAVGTVYLVAYRILIAGPRSRESRPQAAEGSRLAQL